MFDARPRINSAEVADQMLKLKRPVSAPELSTLLEKQYPNLLVEKHDIYIRLKGFYLSEQADCVMNDNVRPRTFHLKSISSNYFKFRHGRKTDIGNTAIVKNHANWHKPWKKLTKSQKEKALMETRALCRKMFDELLLKRRHSGSTLSGLNQF